MTVCDNVCSNNDDGSGVECVLRIAGCDCVMSETVCPRCAVSFSKPAFSQPTVVGLGRKREKMSQSRVSPVITPTAPSPTRFEKQNKLIRICHRPTMVPWQEKLRILAAASASATKPGRTNKPATLETSMATPTTARSSPCACASLGNGPGSPPVLYQPFGRNFDNNEEDERCRACHSTALFTDWRQGDRVCTNCGVVAEEKICDDRPEWKDFNETEDLVKGLPSKARSGLVPVDETKYLGGLQPTTLSKEGFGGDLGLGNIRKRLRSTNRKMDKLMERNHSKALKDAKLDRQILKEKLKRNEYQRNDEDLDANVRPELETLIIQEEEDAHRMQAALYAEKWSLDRALLLYGDADKEASSISRITADEEREELLARMDSTLRKASQELYKAYSMMIRASQTLQLPQRVRSEVVHRLVRYVSRRDGIRVAGVSSRLSKSVADKEALERLKDYNRTKQMASLGAAILFLTARSLGWTRTMAEICSSFLYDERNTDTGTHQAFIKPKHLSRAMRDFQAAFPEYNVLAMEPAQPEGTSQFAEHFLRRLQLPPVAEAAIRTLLLHCRQEQLEFGSGSGTKLSTLCAAVAYFVCQTGSIMQKLAQQAENSENKRMLSITDPVTNPNKKRKIKNEEGQTENVPNTNGSKTAEDENEEKPFDIFTHSAIVEDHSEKEQYELRRMWDAWREQMPWHRSMVEIERTCGVSKNSMVEFYKSNLYPKREALLAKLKDVVSEDSSNPLQDTPLAPILLIQISIAAALMSLKN